MYTRVSSRAATASRWIAATCQPPERIVIGDEQPREQAAGLSVCEWSLVTLGAAGAAGVVIALGAASFRHRRRRRNAIRPLLAERRIEVVSLDNADSSSTKCPSH